MSIVTSNGMTGSEWREWSKLTEEEQKQLLQAEYKDASLSELEDLQKKLEAEFDKKLKQIEDTRDALMEARGLNAEERAEKKQLLKELRDLEDAIDSLSSQFEEIKDEEAGRHVEVTGNYTLTDGDIEDITEKDPYVNIFDDPSLTDEEYLIAKGVIEAPANRGRVQTMEQRGDQELALRAQARSPRHMSRGDANAATTLADVQQAPWVAKGDYNRDGIINQDDIDAALADRHGQTHTVSVQVPGMTWTGIAYDAATKTWTLTGTDAEGNAKTIRITGNFKLDFNGGLTRESLPMLQDLPASVQKNVMWMGQSVQDWLAGVSPGEREDTVRLGSIDNYSEIRGNVAFNEAKASFDPNYGEVDALGPTKNNPDDLRAAYQLAIDRLFAAYDEGRISEEQMKQAWENLKAELTAAPHNLNQRDWANVIKMVVHSLASNGTPEQFRLFVGSAIGYLEAELTSFGINNYGISQHDQAIIVIMELFSGKSGQYSNILSRFGHVSGGNVVAGQWTDHIHNMAVLDEALAIIGGMENFNTTDAAGRVRQARNHEDALRVAVGQTGLSSAPFNGSFKQEYHRQLSAEGQNSLGFYSSMGTAFNNAMFDLIMGDLEGVLFDAQGNFVADPFTAIKDAMAAALGQPVSTGSANGVGTSYSPLVTPEMLTLGFSYLINSIFTSETMFTESFRNEFMAKFAGPARAFLQANPLRADDPHRAHYDNAMAALGA